MMISDQEAGFIRASKEIKRILDTKDKRKNIVSELASLGVVFKFNHSLSPQLQSLAERIHRIVKNALNSKMIREKPNIFEFHTYLCVIEHILNSRPLARDIRTTATEEFQTVDAFQLMTGASLKPI